MIRGKGLPASDENLRGMRGRAWLIFVLAVFLLHALDADCLLSDCHCPSSGGCLLPVTVQASPGQPFGEVAALPPCTLTRLQPPQVVALVACLEAGPERPLEPPEGRLSPPRAPPAA